MKVCIDGKTVQIADADISSAKALSENFLSSVKANSAKRGMLNFYFATLIAMHDITGEIIRSIDSATLEKIMQNTQE